MKQRVAMTIDEDVLKWVKETRYQTPRSSFVNDILIEAMKKDRESNETKRSYHDTRN